MNWFRNLWRSITQGFRRGNGWRGFKGIDTVKVDDSDDWRRQNDV